MDTRPTTEHSAQWVKPRKSQSLVNSFASFRSVSGLLGIADRQSASGMFNILLGKW